MKSSKLIEIFKDGNLVIPFYLLKNYSKFDISLDEFIFLMYLYNKGDKFLFDPNQFSSDLNCDLSLVMNTIGILSDKGLIKVEVLKNDKGYMEEYVLLESFYNKIALLTIEKVNNEKSDSVNNSTIFELIENEFGRTLSSMEYEIIKAWLDNNISEELIREALKEAVFNGVSNLRYIDKILYEWGKNGFKTVSDVEENRKKRNSLKNEDSDVDLEIVEWNWFDDDE